MMIIVQMILVVLTIMIIIKGMFAINTLYPVPWEKDFGEGRMGSYYYHYYYYYYYY